MRGTRPRMSALLGVLMLLSPALCARAQQPPPSFKVNVRLVNVFVSVTDAAGAPIPALTAANFTIAEDDHPQKIAYFERQASMPLSIVLAIDTSGSVHKDLGFEVATAHQFVHSLMRPVDHLDLLDFNSDVREVVPFTSSLRRIDDGLDRLSEGPATALYDAIYLGAQNLREQQGRKVLVVISDGGNTVRGTGYPEALEQALRSEAMVYSIIDLPVVADAGRDEGGEHALITLSEQTGGRYFYAQNGNLTAAFKKVSEDLRTQYMLGYYPDRRLNDSSFRSIKVGLTGVENSQTDRLRYRTGYYATPTLGQP